MQVNLGEVLNRTNLPNLEELVIPSLRGGLEMGELPRGEEVNYNLKVLDISDNTVVWMEMKDWVEAGGLDGAEYVNLTGCGITYEWDGMLKMFNDVKGIERRPKD